jgi:UDP-glucose 4-epimerase
MTRVLVTGASSTVGRALVAALLDDPAVELVVTVDDASGATGPSTRLLRLAVDLSRPRELKNLLRGPIRAHAVDTLVHSALHGSPTHGGRRARTLDVEVTRELLRLAEEHPTLKRLVYRSSAEVYHCGADAVEILDEDHPLELSPSTPQWIRDRAEADLAVCAHAGLSRLRILVLRCAEIFARDAGSQLHDYVQSKVCMRPLGYDPMVELLSVEDAVRALVAAIHADAQGVFNIPGADVLPLSRVITCCGRLDVPVPGPLLFPAYRLRSFALGTEFRYDMNAGRFHYGAVLDGTRARAVLGYTPRRPLWWTPVRAREPRPVADRPA